MACGSGLGLRQGEFLAFGPDDIDWLKSTVTVARQLKMLRNKPIFALPKFGKVRTLPLPESVKIVLAEHMREYPPIKVTLPFGTLNGKSETRRLFFSSTRGELVLHNQINNLWRAARGRVGIPQLRKNGTHALRHYFASVLLDGGESIKAVSEWLGHHSAAFTLSVYTHLMPTSEDRMRSVIDRALIRPSVEDHGPVTAQWVDE